MISLRKLRSRRVFLRKGALGLAASLVPCQALALLAEESAADLGSRLAKDPMRPRFHLLPARNWMNDPNGPIYFNGQYHMFFQYNPYGATWGNISWHHAVSPDMLHWTHRPLALTPTPGGFDSFGVFSGSAFQAGKHVYVVYTGTKKSTPELATIRDGQNRVQESQCLAWSEDPELVTWTKAHTPIIPMPPPGMKITGFRDPSVWKAGEQYFMVVASGIAREGGCVLLYRSGDLHNWEYLHPLTSGIWNGKPTANPCDDGEMWECPDFLALEGGHVLIYSTVGKVFWQSGLFDENALTFTPVKTGLLDLDAFYAPKTQSDAHGRRILWGWVPERRDDAAMRSAGWSGMMSLPRVLNPDRDGTLRISTLPEAAVLRGTKIQPTIRGNTAALSLSNATGEALCSGLRGSSFNATFSCEGSMIVQITYGGSTNLMNVDGNDIQLRNSDVPSIHAYIDGSVIELILGNRIGCTKRFYYTRSSAPDIHMQVSGSQVSLQAWTIKPISADRLTRPSLG